MTIILLIGFLMAALSVWFWYLELKPFLDAITNRKWWVLPFAMIFNLPKLSSFLIDIGITLFCVANLGFGGGVIGGVTGLFISNVISCFIIYYKRQTRQAMEGKPC